MKRILLSLLSLSLLCSCTTIHYRSQVKIPIYVGAKRDHFREFSVRGVKDFYLWGFVPQEKIVWVDKVVRQAGVDEASKLRIEEFQTFGNWLTTLFTFGMYTPISFRIHGFGKRRTDDRDF